ncbi:MAG: GAF domain-containing protein [Anaerolineales bacterium]|nr:GAF domain-containing protein [Anaerolineales bacterium]
MLSRFINYFSGEEDKDPSFIRLTRNILLFVIAVCVALLPLVTGIVGGEDARNPLAFVALSIIVVLELISLFFVYRGSLTMTKIVVPMALLLAVAVISSERNGLKNTAIVAIPVILVISAILLGRRSLYLTTPIAIICAVFVAYMDLSGRTEYTPAGLDDAIIVPVLLLGAAGIIHLLINRLNENIERARASEEIQKRENAQLNELQASLEERVYQRTAELQQANQINERRARQFQAVAEVTRIISSIQNLETLLPRITEVISEQFGVYHTGIFLLDNNKNFAVLRAANSPGGQKMLEREHKLQIGQTGIVGFVTATGQPRIALDVGADAVFFNNPDLPSTRSEMALPLRYAGEIIGALDVQSTEPNAFNQDDVDVLFTLADQVAVAINNARTIEEAQRSLTEAQIAVRKSTLEAWQVLRPRNLKLGLSLKESTIKPLENPLKGDHIEEALSTGRTVLSNKGDEKQGNLAIPIRLRGQVVGVVNIGTRNQIELTQDEVDIAESIAERLSLAIESATLLQAAQYRADLERVTTDITSRISASTRFETILQTAAQELSRALGGSDVLVQIEPVALELSAGNE